jgi:hypothetical protein
VLLVLAALAASVMAVVLLLALTSSPAHAEDTCPTTAGMTTCTFSPTGGEQTFRVPTGVSSIHVVA